MDDPRDQMKLMATGIITVINMRCTTDTVHESIHLTTRDHASTSLKQVRITPSRRDDTNNLTPKGEQISPLCRDEVRGTRGKLHVGTQQLLEVRRGKCERLQLRDATACLQRRLHVVQVVSTRQSSRR
jgi:hypothetical protein